MILYEIRRTDTDEMVSTGLTEYMVQWLKVVKNLDMDKFRIIEL
jgi:hypothetical protein